MEYLESKMETFILHILIAGNGMAQIINQFCDFNATLMCSVNDENCDLPCPKIKHTQYNLQQCISF